MSAAGMKLVFATGGVCLLLAVFIGQAGAHDKTAMLPPKGHVVVLSGPVVEVAPKDLTIMHDGQEIVVKGGTLIHSGMRSFRDPLSEGMMVTVEGVTGSANEIVASRVTRGPYYDEAPYQE